MQYLELPYPVGGHHDVVLGTAFVLHEDLICPGCGQYKDETWGDLGAHAVDDTLVCGGCAALERYRKDTKHPVLGLIPRVVNTLKGLGANHPSAPAPGHAHAPADSLSRLSAPAAAQSEELLG